MSATSSAAVTEIPVDRSNSRKAFSAGFLAWTFDAFDFFILTYVIGQVARDFHQPIKNIAFTLTASLLMRPVGAFIFGLLADRYGRRIPLMLDILFYSAVEVASGFAPTYHTFLILRFLYGVGMGGVWGVGASLALESASAKSRGCSRESFRKVMRSATCLRRSLFGLSFRAGVGDLCFLSVSFPLSSRS